MSQAMRFRLFVNQSEGKMWAIGVDTVDPESGLTGSWMTMWGPLEELDTHIGRGYYFSRIGKLKPIDDAAVRRSIESKLDKGYTEKFDPSMGHWPFVPYPKYGTKQGLAKMLVLESNLPKVRSKTKLAPFPRTYSTPVQDRSTVVHDGEALALPEASVLDAAGYTPIGF